MKCIIGVSFFMKRCGKFGRMKGISRLYMGWFVIVDKKMYESFGMKKF